MRRLTHFALPGLLVLSMIIGGCGGGSDSGGDGEAPAMDYSGTYNCEITGDNSITGTVTINQSGSDVTAEISWDDEGLTGTVSGNIMTLSGGGGSVTIGFSEDGQAFSGMWSHNGDSGGITGTKIS